MKTVKLNPIGRKPFEIEVKNYGPHNKYIKKVILNGKVLNRIYITQKEIDAGGKLEIIASAQPETKAPSEGWISSIENVQ